VAKKRASSCLEDLVRPEEAAALHVQDAALVVVLELLKVVDGELVPLGGLLVEVLRDGHPLLRLLRHDGELEPLVVAQQGQYARRHLAEKLQTYKREQWLVFKRIVVEDLRLTSG